MESHPPLQQTVYLGAGALAFSLIYALYSAYLAIYRPRFKTNPVGMVLVTGTSSGIGRDVAIGLAKKGYVVAAGVRKEADAEKLRELGLPNILPVIIDVAKQESIDKAFEQVSRWLQVKNLVFSGLVNNAGILSSGPLEFHDIKEVRAMYDVNVFGLMSTTAKFLPLIRQSQGRIINISSMTSYLAVPLYMSYSSSKFAVEGLTDSLRQEVHALGVSVSLVTPGMVKTDLFSKELNNTSEEGRKVYAHLFESREKGIAKEMAMSGPTDPTVSAVVHAMSHPRPYTRYFTGVANGLPHWFVHLYMMASPTRVADLINAYYMKAN